MEFFAPIFIIVLIIIVFLAVFFSFVPVGLWISATASGLKVGIGQLVAMRIRKVVPSRIINPAIKSTKAGMSLSLNKLEAGTAEKLLRQAGVCHEFYGVCRAGTAHDHGETRRAHG